MNLNQNLQLVLATVSFCSVAVARLAALAQETRPPVTVIKPGDIPSKVVIEGWLGYPIGTLLVIRGAWSEPTANNKYFRPFIVAAVNGKELPKKITLYDGQVVQFESHFKGNRGAAARPWTWKFDWRGDEPPPEPKVGETWEMLGMETGRYENPSPEFWNELRGVQSAGPGSGFGTRFEFIALKIIETPR